MRWRWLLLASLVGCPLLQLACSASNGDAIPSEVRDAEALDANGPDPIDRDSSSTDEDGGTPNPPKDGGPKDAARDVAVDATLTSADVRIGEVYVNRTGGDQGEFIELRGPVGAPVDDLFVRVIDDNGTASTTWSVAATGTTIGATGTWVIGGALAGGRIDKIIPNFDGWGLDNAKGAVQLMRGANKQLIDVVGYNTDPDGGVVPQPSTDPKSTGEGMPFTMSATGTDSFGRKPPMQGDTNDNRADFCAMNQSAGAANGVCK